MENKVLTAQYVIPHVKSEAASGFNMRIHGDSRSQVINSWLSPDTAIRLHGWEIADKMIDEGKIYYTHIFPHGCREDAFTYGGTYVCNACENRRLNKTWWNIKVQKDGNAWFVCGEGFENLQESDNYAFGDTKQEALDNYYNLMSNKSVNDKDA